MKYSKQHSTIGKIYINLWIILSFIPLLNGIGFVYIGNKTSNTKWILEGVIYQIPWFLAFIFTPASPSLQFILIAVGTLLTLISIARSFIVYRKYDKLIETNQYKQSRNKIKSIILCILSALPLINGVPFIYLGIRTSDKQLINEGIFFEAIWVIDFLLFLIIPQIVGFALAFEYISLIMFLKVNFSDPELYKPGETFYESKEEKPQNPKREERKEYSFKSDRNELNDLKKSFDKKEKKLSEIIAKRFSKSNLTYSRFMTVLDNSHENFYKQMEKADELNNLNEDNDEKINRKIQNIIENLKLINGKMDELMVELIVKDSDDGNEQLETLVEEMDDLTKSVKNYK